MVPAPVPAHVDAISASIDLLKNEHVRMKDSVTPLRASAIGVSLLAVSSLGWGINFPITKVLLGEWPPMAARGLSAFGGAILLALIAMARRESLRIAPYLTPRLIVVSVLTVTSWAAGMGLALLWLKASEAAVFAVTAPLWTSVLAWPLLGERPTAWRAVGLIAAFAGVFVLIGGGGLEASFEKLPGALAALGAAFANALGTIAVKQKPFPLKPVALASWQMLIGCIPVAMYGLLVEQPSVAALTTGGWAALLYTTTVQFCLCYACWFAALERMPASTASISTLLVPVVGVVASAVALAEPITGAQLAALVLTLGGVALAMRN
jgi:drug/metabolite transporter (DMT)-like permease